jgi:hypothetical protein
MASMVGSETKSGNKIGSDGESAGGKGVRHRQG